MTISARSVAVSGFGFGALAIAVSGFTSVVEAPADVPVAEPHQFFANFDRSLMESVDRKLRRRKDEEEIVALIAVAVTKRMLH